MKVLRVLGLSSLQTAVKLISSFALAKIIALSSGPNGFGLFAQFQAFLSLVAILATSLLGNGLIKFSAEFSGDESRRERLYSTALWCALGVAAISGALLIGFASQFSQIAFHSDAHADLIRLAGGANALVVVNAMLISVLTGERDFRPLILSNIAANLSAVGGALLLLWRYGVPGAMAGYVCGQAAALLMTAALVRKTSWFERKTFLRRIDWPLLRNMLPYALTALISAGSMPAIEFMLRNRLAIHHSWTDVGFWQSLTRISDAYLLVINSFFAIYLIPNLANSKGSQETGKVVFDTARLVVPIAVAMATALYFLREEILRLLFSPDFLPVREMFAPQLFGDVLRVLAAIAGYIILTKSKPRVYFLTEIIFLATYWVAGLLLIDRLGWSGGVYAFLIAHLVYLAIIPVFLLPIFRNRGIVAAG